MSGIRRTLLLGGTLFFLCLSFLLADAETMLLYLSAVAIHESGHILAAWLCGVPVRGLCFTPAGLFLSASPTRRRERWEAMCIYLSGPLANLAACAVSAAACAGVPQDGKDAALRFFCANLVPAVFNLLPLPYSDGDGVARLLLSPCRHGDGVLRAARILSSGAFFLFASYRFFHTGNGFCPFAFSFFLLLSAVGGKDYRIDKRGIL